MISRRSAHDNGHDRRAAAVDLSSVFGTAAAASVRRCSRPRRRREAREREEPTSGIDAPASVESAAVDSAVVEPEIMEDDVHVPSSRNASARPAPPRRLGVVKVRDRQHVDLLLLAAAATGPANGRELIDLVRERSDGLFALSLPVVIHQLHRLTNNRLIEVTGERGARRRYFLTPLGERVLATRRREWEAFSHGLSRVLDAAE
jgi:DNA-binding PadR family transcriptional regulator